MVESGIIYNEGLKMFRGTLDISMDSKSRFAMPIKFRSELIESSQGQLVVTIDVQKKCLVLYPLLEWKKIEKRLYNLSSLDEVAQRLTRLLIGNAVDINLDKSGRLLVPARLREYALLDKRNVLVGQLNKIQLWNLKEWHKVVEYDLFEIKKNKSILNNFKNLIL